MSSQQIAVQEVEKKHAVMIQYSTVQYSTVQWKNKYWKKATIQSNTPNQWVILLF